MTSDREGTEAISDTVTSLLHDFIPLCLYFAIPCLGNKEEMEMWRERFPVLGHSAAWNCGLLGTISKSAVKTR